MYSTIDGSMIARSIRARNTKTRSRIEGSSIADNVPAAAAPPILAAAHARAPAHVRHRSGATPLL
eukprot:907899-Rhodomonas_salina.10